MSDLLVGSPFNTSDDTSSRSRSRVAQDLNGNQGGSFGNTIETTTNSGGDVSSVSVTVSV